MRLRLALAIVALSGLTCGPPAAPSAPPRVETPRLDAEDLEVGKRTDAELLTEVKELRDAKLHDYVASVLGQVAARAGRRVTWTLRILDTSHITVRSAPGGFIYVTRGLLAALGSEAELAAALAHEVAHVEERHWRREGDFARAHGIDSGDATRLGPEDRVALLAELREDEHRADSLAIGYLRSAGYAVDGLSRVLELFAKLERMAGKDRVPPLLRTHPRTQLRIERLGKQAAGGGGEWKRREYLERIAGLPFGEDPRQGYLLGQRYLNPAADVELEFPEKWRLRLIGQDLMAVLPGQATIALFARSEHGGADATANALVGEGPAFQKTTVAEHDAWIQVAPAGDGLSTHNAVIGGPSAAWVLAIVAPSESGAPREVLEGARRIRDTKLAQVTPLHIRLQVLDAETSLRDLDRVHPSRTNLETLALINGVEIDQRLPKGTVVKRIDE